MGLWVILNWLLLGFVVTVTCQWNIPPPNRRQGETRWNNYQPVIGVAQQYDRRYPQVEQSRQLSQQQPITVQCQEDSMVVTVLKDLFRKGKLIKVSDLTLGTELCRPNFQREDSVVFQNGLQECGSSLQISFSEEMVIHMGEPITRGIYVQLLSHSAMDKMTPDFLIYSTELTYSPTPSGNVPIIRTNAAKILVQCYYQRNANVSSNAIKPTWIPFSSTVSVEERLSFSLQLMNDDWSAPRTSTVFHLGDVFHIEASLDTANHVPMMVFVDSCVATLYPDVSSDPHYDIIALNGCLMDGKQEDSSSAFRSPRTQSNKLQFMVDAFRFTGTDASMIYVTCNLRAVAVTQTPDPVNKACSFSKSTNSWSPVEGTPNICRCCDTGNCMVSPQSRRIGPYIGGGRGKRQAGPYSEQEHGLATLGPLMIIEPNSIKTLTETQDSGSLEFWVLITIGSLCICFVLAICVDVIRKQVFKKPIVPQIK